MNSTSALLPAFRNPVHDSQRVFRAVLYAMSHPGRAVQLPECPLGPWPLEPGAAAVALALFDVDTPVWVQDDEGTVADYFRFHCGCRITADTREAAFAIITDPREMPSVADFAAGTPEYPDRSATLVMQVHGFTGARALRLTGPGIQSEATVSISGVSERFWDEVRHNHAGYPCGADFLFVSAHQVVGLPRSIRVESA